MPLRVIAGQIGRSENALTARRALRGLASRRAVPVWTARQDELIRLATEAGVPASRVAATQRVSVDRIRARRRELLGQRSRFRRYQPWEDAAIIETWAGGVPDLSRLAERLGRSPDAIRIRARSLGVHRPLARPRWTKAEDQRLRDGYVNGHSCAEVSDALMGSRSAGSVSARARKLGLASYARAWSEDEAAALRRGFTTGSPINQLAVELTRTPEAVRQRARRLGIRAPGPAADARSGERWTAAEDAVLSDNPGEHPGVLARTLGRSDRAVRRRQRILGVRSSSRSPHYAGVSEGSFEPAEDRLIRRELGAAGGGNGRSLLALADRLGRSPGELRRRMQTLKVGVVSAAPVEAGFRTRRAPSSSPASRTRAARSA